MPRKYSEAAMRAMAMYESAGTDSALNKGKSSELKKLTGIQKEQTKSEFIESSKEAYREFASNVKHSMMESCLGAICNASFGNTISVINDDTKLLSKALISNFIKEQGYGNLLQRMSNKSLFLSEMALEIKNRVDRILENVDPEDKSTLHADTKEDFEFFDSITGDEDVQDITDAIKMRVSRATEDFIQKNISDKVDIKYIMQDTKDKIDGINTGDEELDEEIAQESTIKMKRKIKEFNKKPRNVYEQLVYNLTESVIANEATREKFTKDGRLDMDAIMEKADCIYTVMETIQTLGLVDMDEDYIRKVIEIK